MKLTEAVERAKAVIALVSNAVPASGNEVECIRDAEHDIIADGVLQALVNAVENRQTRLPGKLSTTPRIIATSRRVQPAARQCLLL